MNGLVRPALTLEQIERQPDSPQARSRPITDTAWRESRLRVIGTWWCWCGRTRDHDWPGKNAGAAHPRGEVMAGDR